MTSKPSTGGDLSRLWYSVWGSLISAVSVATVGGRTHEQSSGKLG